MALKQTLIVSPPDAKPLSFVLKGDRVGLGREADNQIQIEVDSVSSSHCEFRKVGDAYQIVDLGSTNGTRVNGQKVTGPTPLQDGDRILLGEKVPAHFLMLEEGTKAAAAAVLADSKQQQAGASYANMDVKLQQIEASIAAKQQEYQQLVASSQQLEGELAQRKQSAGAAPSQADAAAIQQMEQDLMMKTQRIQMLQHDLSGPPPGKPAIAAKQPSAGPGLATPGAATVPLQSGGTPARKIPQVAPTKKPKLNLPKK